MRRRDFLPAAGTAVLASAAFGADDRPNAQKGRLKQGVTNGVFGRSQLSMDERCRIASEVGCTGFDLVGPKDWPTLKKYGLKPTMYNPPDGSTIPYGLNRKEHHEKILNSLRQAIDVRGVKSCEEAVVHLEPVGVERAGHLDPIKHAHGPAAGDHATS